MDYKIRERDYLTYLLDKSKLVLNKEMIEYLDSIINLEFSVVKDGIISDEQRNIISILDVYRESARYNIYQRAITLLKNKDNDLQIDVIEKTKSILNIYKNHLVCRQNIFEYNYGPYDFNDTTKNFIGQITLYNAFYDKEYCEEKMMILLNDYDSLMREKDLINKYSHLNLSCNTCLTREDDLGFINKRIKDIEKDFNKIDKGLTDDDKKILELANDCYNLIMEDYGLSKEDLNNKILVKKIPGLSIKANNESIL